MKSVIWLAAAPFLFAAEPHTGGLAPEQALQKLLAGNQRHVNSKELHPDATAARRKLLASEGQHPFAVILGCSDSRVPPELLFDQGLGDLFVIRDAGNVVDDEVLGSIEYAVEHLGARLVVVLGHEKCGAVSAAVGGGEAPGHIKTVVESIRPVVDEAGRQPGDKVHNCVVANARRAAAAIRGSAPILKEMVDHGKIAVVAADYDLASGKVTLLEALPKGPAH